MTFGSRKILRLVLLAVLLVVLNTLTATVKLWRQYDTMAGWIESGRWPIEQGQLELSLSQVSGEGSPVPKGRFRLTRGPEGTEVELTVAGQDVSPVVIRSTGASVHLAAPSKGAHFVAEEMDGKEIRQALDEAAAALPRPGWGQRILATVFLRPFVTGVRLEEGRLSWRVSLAYGSFWTGGEAGIREGAFAVKGWEARLEGRSAGDEALAPLPSGEKAVPAQEMTACLAEAIRILVRLAAPLSPPSEEVRRSGAGWMVYQDGRRQMYLAGTPYEMGHQHGSLDPVAVREVCRRTVYGVGLLYSLKNGEWFPAAARKLVERQRPFIARAYFEEMKGLADGAGLPLELVQMANIFPEFFHCSGAALMGTATVGGELLHARVLDYMVGIGLQDYAVVMAVVQPGVNRFVTVGYAGFIGSVSGMNEKQVAIGEMGGDGQGDWDGVPMSLLIRQALERCDTLEQVETLMRESPRTCEYYYVVSDGKGPDAVGIAATPAKFETFRPGESHHRFNHPVPDAVLISGGERYEKLVARVRDGLGKISRDDLLEIIKRPVAMKSNLHNVLFQPQSLQISVADAVRGGLACDQPYRIYTWDELFSPAPSS